MRAVILVVGVTMFTAAPLFAQDGRGYVSAAGGFAMAPDATSGDVAFDVGVRVAPRLSVFGDIGRFHNLQPSGVLPSVDTTTSSLSARGLDVAGTGRVPAWHSTGGLRYDVPMMARVSPYVAGGIGFARLDPTAQFTFTSGALPDGTTPSAGTDVTTALVTAGDFTAPAATNAFMFTLGGGVQIPVVHRLAADVGYRFSRIEADTPVNAQGLMFGVGYRF